VRILFLSGTTVGGSGRSQRELASQLRGFGHEVMFVADTETRSAFTRWVYEQLSDLAVRMSSLPGLSVIRRIESVPGRRTKTAEIGGIRHHTTPIPENAAKSVIAVFRPDVVVGSSVLRISWRKVRAMCRARGIPTVLYIRETEALNHFSDWPSDGDLVVANAESLAREIQAVGVVCEFIPSVIDTAVTETDSTREVALVINPIESRGIDIVWNVAERLPNIRFAVQESWPLEPEALRSVEAAVADLANVEFRRAAPPGPKLYGDTRVLLVPYRIDNRPRVIAEAQANGIPVIAGDVPALVEAIGDGGLVADLDDIDAWCTALQSLWTDAAEYGARSSAAIAHSMRAEIDPGHVARRFEELVVSLLEAHVSNAQT
jgi:glycosyltransferase involved in cell wall biosynthesis